MLKKLFILLFFAPSIFAAFPTGWSYKVPLVINSDSVRAAWTAMPILLTDDNFPDGTKDADITNAQSDGGDLRFSANSDGTGQLPCDVVRWSLNSTPANSEIEIWVKHSVITSADTLWVWYGTAGSDTQPAEDATYGSENVWTSFTVVHHFDQVPTDTLRDATSSDIDLGPNGTMTSGDLVAAQFGYGIEFDGSDDMLASIRHASLTSAGLFDGTLLMWVGWQTAVPATNEVFVAIEGSSGENEADNSLWYIYNTAQTFPTAMSFNYIHEYSIGSNVTGTWGNLYELAEDNFGMIATVRDVGPDTIIYYANGDSLISLGGLSWNDPTATGQDSAYISFAARRTTPSTYASFTIEEFWFSTAAFTTERIKTVYSNQKYPAAFITEGTEEEVGAGGGGADARKIILIQ